MYYGDKRTAKVMIMSELVDKGWKVYGYTPDESDSMQDIYSPSHWDGIAEKNGFVLVIDNHNASYSGYQVKKYDYSNMKNNVKTNSTIEKLTARMNCPASSPNEKLSCAHLIEKEEAKLQVEPTYIIEETFPTFSGNPKNCTWHIEKAGQILAKGNGVFAVNDYDWENKEKSAAEQKAEKLEAFINKIEKVLINSDALKAEVIVIEKKVIKPVVKTDKTINVGDLLSFSHRGHFWIVIDIYNVGDQVRVTYELVGSEKRGYKRVNNTKRYYQALVRLEKEMEEGKTKVHTLQEITEYEEKTVFVKTKRKQTKQTVINAPAIETTEEVVAEEVKIVINEQAETIQATININEAKNGIEIKFTDKPSLNVIEGLKEMGFRWSSYNSVWYTKQTPDRLKFATMFVETFNDIAQEEPEQNEQETVSEVQEATQEATQEQQKEVNPYAFKIDLNYVYHDVHFKSWNDSVEDISKFLDHENINYYVSGGKFICTGLTVDDVAWVEVVNKENGAIIFYDDKYNELPNNSSEEEEPQPEQEKEMITEPIIINGKIKVKEITFEWSESSMIKDNLTVLTFAEAEESVRLIASNVTGGYDKTKFIITWTDGNTYTGRLDVEKEDENKQTPIKDHITDWLLFLTGDKRPSHMSIEQYRNTLVAYAISEEDKKEYYEFFEKYALTDESDNVIYHNFNTNNEQEETETMTNSFDDLMNKFDDIEITTESKVSADDSEFCKEQEEIYKQTIAAYNSLQAQLEAIKPLINTHGKKYGEMNVNGTFYAKGNAFDAGLSKYDLEKNTNSIKDRFISNICHYFMKKYSVTVNYEKIQKKHDSSVTYEQIIDEIYLELNGYNFTEKAEQEIKENSKDAVRNSDKMSIKNSKLIIDGRFAYADRWDGYRLSGSYEKILKALQHFEDGSTAGNAELIGKYCGYDNERKTDNYERYEPTTMNSVKSIKFLKNGKLEIEFTTNQQAAKFAKEYCGYNQKSA